MTKPKIIRCPICGHEMGRLPLTEGATYYCDECNTYWEADSGKLKEATEKGEYTDLGYAKEQAKSSTAAAKVYDVYFTSKDKKRFIGIVELGHEKGWMILTNRQGKEILINSDKVNIVEEV